MASMISSIVSVPRGVCARKPVRYELSPEEAMEVAKPAERMEDEKMEEIPGFPKELWFKKDEDEAGVPGEQDDEEDEMMGEQDEDDDEAEDTELKASDAIFLCGRTEDELSCVEMHVYDEETGSLYVHHDVTLPAFPLALEWLRLDRDTGSFVAVGTFETHIEIWNLDVLDALEPTATLGKRSSENAAATKSSKTGSGTKKKKKKRHVDAVTCLSWNRLSTGMLASGSVDATVKVWDLSNNVAASSFDYDAGVQTMAWHPREAAALATGGAEKRLALRDCRQAAGLSKFAPLDADIECLAWHTTQPAHLVCSCEDGLVACFDVRRPADPPLWRNHAHSKSVPAIALNDHGLLATASNDKTVKLFDQHNNLVAERNLAVGKLFALAFDQGDPYLLAAAGSKATLAVWDTRENDAVEAFSINHS